MDEPQTPQEGERRGAVRRACSVKRTILGQIEVGGNELATHLYLVNLAEGGMRVHLDRDFPEESEFRVRFPLNRLLTDLEEGEFDLRCRVIWMRKMHGGTCAYGLAFEGMNDQDRATLDTLLDRCGEQERTEPVRLKHPLELKVRFPDEENWTPFISARELSEEGLRFQTRRELEKGEVLTLRMKLHPGMVVCQAEVSWCRPRADGVFDVGCSFVDLQSDYRSLVAIHIRRDLHLPL